MIKRVSHSQTKPEEFIETPLKASGRLTSAIFVLIGVLRGLRAWTSGHWIRGVLIASTLLLLIGLTIGGWAYLANVALRTGQVTIAGALEALDQDDTETARNAAGKLLTNGQLSRTDFGGPLFILGTLKYREAEAQTVPERRRNEYLIAARYLSEARAYSLPADREPMGALLLGTSLIESGQFDEGVRVLNDLAATKDFADNPIALETQYLLAETCLLKPNPDLERALRVNATLLANKNLTNEQRAAAVTQRALCLSRLERFHDARKVIAELSDSNSNAVAALFDGMITLDEVDAKLRKLNNSDRGEARKALTTDLAPALRALQKASSLDDPKGWIAQQACYQRARGLALQGDFDAALKQYARTRQLYGDSYEGLAATLGEAEVLRGKGEYEDAMLADQRMLEAYLSIPVYRSKILPIERIREHLILALNDLFKLGRFEDALALIDHFSPPFSQIEQLELRGNALEQWGKRLTSTAVDDHGRESDRATGLERLRAAGVAFEQLAELRFASRSYSSDLWRAAENFHQGQSFSRTITALQKYMQYEPELRNAQALLRLGQSYLALGQVPQSINSLEECIEFHPLDTSTFQARIDCAKAYWCQGQTDLAEQLLRENIDGSSLNPLSPEWKDSLFELGLLLHEKEKFEDAIDKLEEAIQRYPHDPQRLVAQFVTGESYRRWAQQMLAESQKSRSSNERQKAIELATQRLTTALSQFEEVQRTITLKTHDIHSDPLMGAMLRNCYMLEGTVLFDLGRYKEAIETYSNVSSLYPDEPFVLETFVQIANCWRQLERFDNARGAVHQAQIVLDRLPPTSDFASTTVHSREEWRTLLNSMSKW